MKKNGHKAKVAGLAAAMARAVKPAKRKPKKRKPAAKRPAYAGRPLDVDHAALTGHFRAVGDECEECLKPGWWAAVTGDVGFAPVYVGGQPDRWFQARAEGTKRVNMIRIWADAKADVISQDGVTMRWQE